MSTLISQDFMPGMGDATMTIERELTWGEIKAWQITGVKLDSATVDAGNTPTTILRRGLILGQVTATGEYKHYTVGATDGSQIPVGVLYQDVDMLVDGVAANKFGRMLISGQIKKSQLLGFDEEVRRCFHGRFIFDDLLVGSPSSYPVVEAKTADYTIVLRDNNKTFTNQGAAGAVVFTLPTCAVGLRFRFFVEANQNVTITAASGKLVAFNNAVATSIAYTTANEKVGAGVEIVANADGSKWLAINSLGSETQTPTIS